MKGISPLLASIILIAITLAIAGVLTTWAVQITRRPAVLTAAECTGSLDIDREYLRFDAGKVTFIMRNNKAINLTDVRVFLIYPDATVGTYVLEDPIGPLGVVPVTINTGKMVKPDRIELVATLCPEWRVSAVFP